MPDRPRPVQQRPHQPVLPLDVPAPEPALRQAVDQPAALRQALKLPADATDEDVLRQASGLVASIYALRKKVYVGIIDPILRANGVNL